MTTREFHARAPLAALATLFVLAACSAPPLRTDAGDAGRVDTGPSCPAALTLCGDRCADTQTDRAHCGMCGTACAAGQVCSAGTCMTSCPMGQTACGGRCADTQTDRAHCGACGTACGAGQVCQAGACVVQCTAGFMSCAGACRDLQTDRAHCGACGTACGAGQVCNMGRCEVSCTAGLTNCMGSCRDLQTDRAHCGACGAACGAGQVCQSGMCVVQCTAGLMNCMGSCRDTQTDRAHCGACGTACAAGQVCQGGACVVSCMAGQTNCAGSCRDLQTDNANCGTCGAACGAGQVCRGGACVATCGAGLTPCGGACRDLRVDPANCGACGQPCGAGQVCNMGVCGGSCGAPLTQCGAACTNTSYDPMNCGTCGTVCARGANETAACVTGACARFCNPGFGNCDANPANGCETNVQSSATNCGACGVVCPTPPNAVLATCAAGRCGFACATGFADCDGNAANGCEANLQTSSAHCGACGNSCGGAMCSAGRCATSVHNTVAFVGANSTSGGCSYNSQHVYRYDNLGPMPWRQCIVEASRRGAMLMSQQYSVNAGWNSHRNGPNAMISQWNTYISAPITDSRACIVGRDRLATRNDAPLANTLTYDGQVWRWQDLGPMNYDLCQTAASNAGAMIITPYTIGRTGDGYWVNSVHMCNTYQYITASGNGYASEDISSGARSTARPCMIGYVDN